ncbi:MAG: PTS glucose transporter subunit IIA [Acholeplasmataceae bacterium]|nr:PTS glucose transporter subunit IIA [Acholeplasmataceae bacterium]
MIFEFYKPITGKYEDISAAPDNVFQQKLVGSGFVVNPTKKRFLSPIYGKITMIYPTHHVMVIHHENFDLMIHVGFTDVLRDHHYFTYHVTVGDVVSPGDPLFDLNFDFYKYHPHDYLTALVFVQKPQLEIIETTDQLFHLKLPL